MKRDLDPGHTLDDYQLISSGKDIHLQHHRPFAMDEPYHVHPSIEINFLQGCEMDYSFAGTTVTVPAERFCIFWAAQPHRVQGVRGVGTITNAYISLQEFWSWPLPDDFVETILAGTVVAATDSLDSDISLATRLAAEIDQSSDQMNRLHCLELQARVTRLALSGWQPISPLREASGGARVGGNAIANFEKMLRFVATQYFEPITLGDVADAAGVSENYANALFKKTIGTTVKAHINSVRIFRARMMLAETDAKIISIAHDSGFRSLSAFYETFQKHVGTSPAQFRTQTQK